MKKKVKEIVCVVRADGGICNPSSLYYDCKMNELYICDMGNARIVKYDCRYGKLKDLYLENFDQSELQKPLALTMDKENRLFVTDAQQNCIFQFKNGKFVKLSADVDINLPGSIAVGSNGSIYISDFHHNRILKWRYPDQAYGMDDIPCSQVYGIFYQSFCLYIADTGHHRILQYNTLTKTFTVSWSGIVPIAVAVSGENTIYFSESRRLYCQDAAGRRKLLLDRELWKKYGFDRLCHIGAIAVGKKNQLFFSDTIKNCIYEVTLG